MARRGIQAPQLAIQSEVTYDAIQKILRGERKNPTGETLDRLATALGVTIEDLRRKAPPPGEETATERMETYQPGPRVSLPVFAEVSAGQGCFVGERPSEYAFVEASKVAHDVDNYMYVRVRGDSMIGAGIMPESLVLIHRQETVEPGQIALVCLPDGTSTIKTVRYLRDGTMVLIARNTVYEDMLFSPGEANICGRVVEATVRF